MTTTSKVERRCRCDDCGVEGVLCDTLDGEIVKGGRVVARLPAGETLLCAGRRDGSELHRTLCDECAA